MSGEMVDGLLLVAALLIAAISAASSKETCEKDALTVRQIRSFDEYEAFSLEKHEHVTVFCGAFSASSKLKLLPLLDQVGRELSETALRSTAVAWTEAKESTAEGTGDLTSLFPGSTRCHVWPRRSRRILCSPLEQVSSAELDNNMLLDLISKIETLSVADVYDPMGSNDDFLIKYGTVSRAQIERDHPAVRHAMCGGAERCEIERRSNLTASEFVEEYFLWGRPVIITDAMDNWPLMKSWSEFYLSERLESFRKRRRQSGAVQLLNIVDSTEQAVLRGDYDIPYFFPRNGNRSVDLDTELIFVGEVGAKGIKKHLDTGCHQYWVPHVQGSKRWTLWPVESMSEASTAGRDPAFQFPVLTATIRPGEILVFYSGWWHQTDYDVEPQRSTLSFTMYLADIMPSFYLDEYRHALLTREEYKNCMDVWFSPETAVGHLL